MTGDQGAYTSDALIIASNMDNGTELLGTLYKLCRGPRMQALFIADGNQGTLYRYISHEHRSLGFVIEQLARNRNIFAAGFLGRVHSFQNRLIRPDCGEFDKQWQIDSCNHLHRAFIHHRD